MESKIPKYDGYNWADIQAYIQGAVIPAVTQTHSSTLPAEKREEQVDQFSDPKTQELAQEVSRKNLELRGNSDFKMDIFDYQSDNAEDVGALRQSHVADINQEHYMDIAFNESNLRRPPAYFETKGSSSEETRAKPNLDFDTLA